MATKVLRFQPSQDPPLRNILPVVGSRATLLFSGSFPLFLLFLAPITPPLLSPRLFVSSPKDIFKGSVRVNGRFSVARSVVTEKGDEGKRACPFSRIFAVRSRVPEKGQVYR